MNGRPVQLSVRPLAKHGATKQPTSAVMDKMLKSHDAIPLMLFSWQILRTPPTNEWVGSEIL
jgi:hypothetical protein